MNASPAPRPPPPAPFPRWVTGPTGGVRRPGSATLPAPPLCLPSNPRSWGRGESGGAGGDPGRGLGGDPLFWGEHRPSFFVSAPGIGGLEQWKLIQMACPGRGPGGAISELGRFVKTPGERSRRRPCSGRPPRSRRNPPGAPHRVLTCPQPPPERAAGRSLMRPEPAPLSRCPSALGLVSPRILCEEQDEAPVISTPIPPTSCLPSWATKGPWEAGPLQLPDPLQPCDVERGLGLCPAIVCAGGGERLGPGPPQA